MVILGSHADPTGVGLAGLQLRLGHLPRRCLLWWLRSADGALPMAEFAPKSATFGVWSTNGSSSSRNNILRNRFFHEVIEIINEVAAQNTLEWCQGRRQDVRQL